eukprot:SM000092S24522  [mRNA]  locus=s92:453093:454124:+ [translate_table: standard]
MDVAQTPAGAAGATLLLDPGFGGVALVAALTVVLHLWLGAQVIAARSRCMLRAAHHKLPSLLSLSLIRPPPQLLQRGHQQALEVLPQFLVLLVLGGLQHPYTATVGGVLYLLGRFFYFAGYSQGDPSKRLSGGGGMYVVGLLVELACTLSLSVHLGAQLFAQKRV